MPPTLHELGIDHLSVEDRIAVAQAIWESIAEEAPGSLLTAAQRVELEQRLADHQLNPTAVVPWEEVEAEALTRWQK